MRDPICPKCQHDMEPGFVVDHTYGGVASPEWAEGTPDRSIWTGVKMKGKDRFRVETFRCTRCGFLESYARESRE